MLWGLLWLCCLGAAAHEGPALRRPISPEQPAWIIHIDVWNYADPQKIIDMVPEDVRPYVIFNIATSSSDEKSVNGPAIYDSWMKVCAQNRVWTMIQCASGAVNRMPDDGSTTAYEQYFIDYPNFLGFNFAEQFWGFGSDGNPDFPTRLRLFADLMPVCHQYGGYLAVSFTDSFYSSSKMPLAYLKRNQQMRNFLANDPEHFLCFEKYTLKKNFLDIESNCLGAWLGGYAGQYGIRFDSSGWLAANDETDQTKGSGAFVRAAGAIPIAEHAMLTGQTIMDGPELTWTECSQEKSTSTADGYTRRNWGWFPQFENISLDLFRKILDGTIRIPSKSEVIGRTKVCIVNDINKNLNNEEEHNSFVTPENLFDGLYRSAQDQGGAPNGWISNRWWMKTTGRYPTIPQVYAEVSGLQTFKKSTFNKTAFDSWMRNNFPEEYSGDIFAGRHDNGWVTYNPYQYNETSEGGYRICGISTQRASGTIPFQYNTCESISFDYAPYSLGIMKEYADRVTLYLNNYQTTGTVSEDVIRIQGASSQPAVTWSDRGNHTASSVTTAWTDGVLTITVRHNGPLDLSIGCAGTATDRLHDSPSTLCESPSAPPAYEGALQYEAEVADYRSVTIRKSGYQQGHDNYYGQGFAELSGKQSALRFAVMAPKTGYYLLTLRYQADADGSVTIGGNDVLNLTRTSTWATVSTIVQLSEGRGSVTVQNTGGAKTYIDCVMLERIQAEAFVPDADGEYHVNLSDLMASGSVSFDPETGVVTQTNGNGQTGFLRLFFDHADFSHVISLQVVYEGDGDIFRHLTISDNNGNTANPTGSQGAFWSSKYNLDYTNYQQAEASRKVCKLEWTANAPESEPRTMTIKDIVMRTDGGQSGIETLINRQWTTDRMQIYNLQGQAVEHPRHGIHVVRLKDGSTKKLFFNRPSTN